MPAAQAQNVVAPTDAASLSDSLDTAPTGAAQTATSQTAPTATGTDLEGRQTKRILGIIPNFRAVSVDEKLPPEIREGKVRGSDQG